MLRNPNEELGRMEEVLGEVQVRDAIIPLASVRLHYLSNVVFAVLDTH